MNRHSQPLARGQRQKREPQQAPRASTPEPQRLLHTAGAAKDDGRYSWFFRGWSAVKSRYGQQRALRKSGPQSSPLKTSKDGEVDSRPRSAVQRKPQPRTMYLVMAWLFFAVSCVHYTLDLPYISRLMKVHIQTAFAQHEGDASSGPERSVEGQQSSRSQDAQAAPDLAPTQKSEGKGPSVHRNHDGPYETPRFAFDFLSPTGSILFENIREYLVTQKEPDMRRRLAQPLMCAVNVSNVLYEGGYSIDEPYYYSVPGVLEAVELMGGKVFDLPRFTGGNKGDIIAYLNKHLQGNIPTGALVAGCKVRGCHTKHNSDAHIGIVGDKNQFGDIMVYHNNWLRPSSSIIQTSDSRFLVNLGSGVIRTPFMVSTSNLYGYRAAREWMATPWIHLTKTASSQIVDFRSLSPSIDDLDPLNSNYYITIALIPDLYEELTNEQRLHHRRSLEHGNVHAKALQAQLDEVVCQTTEPLRLINARSTPAGIRHATLYDAVLRHNTVRNFYNRPFEFHILNTVSTEVSTWYSVLVYSAYRYWGGRDAPEGEIWIRKKDTKCQSLRQWWNL